MTLVTLTPQQLSAATSMVRWPTSGCRDVIDYLRTYTVDSPSTGHGVIAVSPDRLAENIGLSAHTVIRSLRRLVESRVVIREAKRRGSFPAVWSINGDLTEWDVEWRRDRVLALSIIASMVFSAPYSAEQPRFFSARYMGGKTSGEAVIHRLMAVHRGPFVPRAGARNKVEGSSALWSAEQVAAFGAPLSSLMVPTEPSSKSQEEKVDLSPGVLEVLRTFYEVTGQPAFDGVHQVKSRIVEAVSPLADTGYVVAELRRMGRPMWKAALAHIEVLAAAGPPKPVPRSGPAEFVSGDVQERPVDPADAAAAINAARSVLRPPAKWEDVG